MAQHIVPTRVYFFVFAALMILTGTTVWVAFFDLGPLSDVVALGIASTKAMLVILYFMHVRYSSKLTWIFAAAGFFFLIILLAFTMGDVLTRDWISVPSAWSSGSATLE
ncbi:MAG: cytochrome C oxidase subunit IV family protein [bacterium]